MPPLRLNKLFLHIVSVNQVQACRFSTCRILSATKFIHGLPYPDDKWIKQDKFDTGENVKPAFRKQNWRFPGKLWKAYEEIPCHYREGVNKEPFISPVKKKQIKKYKNRYEERNFYRTDQQRLMDTGKGRLPYDKTMPVITGKHTGPGVEGGTNLAQKLAALHIVQPTGYVDRKGKFKFVPDMVPEFVVPDLEGFKLKPYVSYRTVAINQSKFTARSLFNAFYAEEAKRKVEEETGEKLEDLSPEPTSKLSTLSKLIPWKKNKS